MPHAGTNSPTLPTPAVGFTAASVLPRVANIAAEMAGLGPGAAAMKRPLLAMRVRVDKSGMDLLIRGREAWALDALVAAGERGCTPIERPAPRWSGYVHDLRRFGVAIETIHEPHGGAFPGTHARYVLRTPRDGHGEAALELTQRSPWAGFSLRPPFPADGREIAPLGFPESSRGTSHVGKGNVQRRPASLAGCVPQRPCLPPMQSRPMSSRQRFGKRATSIQGQFAPRLIDMLVSPAYRVLSLSARRIFDRLEIELANHGGKENGRLPCTYEHFQEYGIDRDSIAPAIRELVALGFIEVTEHGTAGNSEFRRPNLFRITYRNTDGAGPKNRSGAGRTDEWRAVKTIERAVELATAARSKKSNPSRGFSHVSVGVSRTEMPSSSTRGNPDYCPSRENPDYLYISGRGAGAAIKHRSERRPHSAVRLSPERAAEMFAEIKSAVRGM